MVRRRIFTPMISRYTARVRLLLWMHFHRRSRNVLMTLRPGWNRLQLNSDKTEVLWCATSRRQHQLPSTGMLIDGVHITPVKSVRDLGIYIDADLSMRMHVKKTVSCCFVALRQLRQIRRYVPTSTFQKLVVALVHSRLDYGNGVLVGIPAHLMRRLQSILNAATRLGLPDFLQQNTGDFCLSVTFVKDNICVSYYTMRWLEV